MGYSKRRTDRNGRVRYTAVFTDRHGAERSAGTFSKKSDAEAAWQDAEALVRRGRMGDPALGRQKFADYALKSWLPHHAVDLTTLEKYSCSLDKHIIPFFGDMRMIDIMPQDIREWITWMQDRKASAWTIQYCKTSLLSSIFTIALNDQVVMIHPCHRIKMPSVPATVRPIVTPEQFDIIYKTLRDADMKLLVETAIESGMRWGELAELRVKDLAMTARIVTVSRKVIEIGRKFHPEGRRFQVVSYPKGKSYRRFKLSAQICAKLAAHIEASGLCTDDLLFARRVQARPPIAPAESVDLGFIDPPSPSGHRYRHGTISGYSGGKCRCDHCRRAYSSYRASRRASGKDCADRPGAPAVATAEIDEHIPRNWFRRYVWKDAREAAGLDVSLRFHDLRHAHASWLLAGGADLQIVKERLGHGSIVTTQKYLHTLPDADETALEALDAIRSRANH